MYLEHLHCGTMCRSHFLLLLTANFLVPHDISVELHIKPYYINIVFENIFVCVYIYIRMSKVYIAVYMKTDNHTRLCFIHIYLRYLRPHGPQTINRCFLHIHAFNP